MSSRTLPPLLALLLACASARTPSTASAPPPPPAPSPTAAAPRDAVVEHNLTALLSQGEALPDHVGPDAARAIDDDLARRPGAWLDALAGRFLAHPLDAGTAQLHYASALWRLRRHDDARTRHAAARLLLRYQELLRTAPELAPRHAETMRALEVIRSGVDVPVDARWALAPARDLSACVTDAPDTTALLVASRACTCGEPLACRVTREGGDLVVALRVAPDAIGVCTECYATASACTLPPLPAGATLRVVVNGAATATWRTDARGRVLEASCAGVLRG